jgi:hypothetical protein
MLAGDTDPWRSRPAQRYVRDGRHLLHDRGIAPWSVWPEGRLPERWWSTDGFRSALDEWAASARKPIALEIPLRLPRLERILADVTTVLEEPKQDHRALWELDLGDPS